MNMWVGLFTVMVGIVLFLWAMRVSLFWLTDRRIARYQNDLLEKHWEEVDHMYRQMRGWRHDYHNHIQTMKAYLAMGRLTELEDYLGELDRDLVNVDTLVKTGNVKMDAILNSKISLAKSKDIRVEATAVVPGALPFSEVDLSLIIGNLMDNAMEACLKIREAEKRFIRIYLDILKGQLYIYVMNAADGSFKKDGGSYLTTKRGAVGGFGLMRLDRVVEKYHGYLNRQDETDIFVTEIMLPL